jgi:phospholipid/cholesterol/gamma-HCH transport system substrate-binding protein
MPMSPETSAARRVGALVLAALAVLALAVLLIGDRQNLFQPKNHYYVRFVSVVGLRQGSDVQLNGVNVGSVERIVLPADTGENLLEVWIHVDARYEQRIRRDSVARIKTLGLLGDKYLELISGSPATDPIPEGGEIPAAPPTNVEQLAEAGEDVMNNIVTISHQLTRILGRMDRGEGLLGELTTDVDPNRKVSVEILDTLEAMRRAVERLESGEGAIPRLINDRDLGDRLEVSLARLDAVLEKAETGEGLIHALLTDAEQKQRFERSLANVEAATAKLAAAGDALEESDAFLGRLLHDEEYGRRVGEDLAALLANLRQVSEKLNKGDGSAARLINDPAFAEALQDIVVGVEESKLLRWLIRNRQKAGIEKRYETTRDELDRRGEDPGPP